MRFMEPGRGRGRILWRTLLMRLQILSVLLRSLPVSVWNVHSVRSLLACTVLRILARIPWVLLVGGNKSAAYLPELAGLVLGVDQVSALPQMSMEFGQMEEILIKSCRH